MLPPQTTDLLTSQAMPEVAAALRSRIPRILDVWTAAVERHLPDADPLTVNQLHDSIPVVLEKIALALESSGPEASVVLAEVCTAHGVVRFQERYKIDELITEYRLLRRVTFDELQAASGGRLTFEEAQAVDMGIDTALQRGVTAFVRYLMDQLRFSSAAESKYQAFLSHDLRNNLAGATQTLDRLRNRLSSSPDLRDAAEDLGVAIRAIGEAVDGMDRLLQGERVRREAASLKLAPVDLRRLAGELLDQVAHKAEAKEVRLENRVPEGVGAFSDRELVTLVLQYLVGNAVKDSPPRGVIRVAAEPDPNGWCVSVTDDGPGIPPDRMAKLHDAFSRGEAQGQPGLGLGLSIASHAARLLGSDLRVESAVGHGARFSFILPPADRDIAK